MEVEVDIDISWLSLLNEKCSKYKNTKIKNNQKIKKKHSVSFFFMWGPSFFLPEVQVGVGIEVEVEVGLGHIADLAQHLNCT